LNSYSVILSLLWLKGKAPHLRGFLEFHITIFGYFIECKFDSFCASLVTKREHRALGDTSQRRWVPHLRDGLIVAKVGIRATREPHSFHAQPQLPLTEAISDTGRNVFVQQVKDFFTR
jgi:hypothetical protein